MDILIVEDEPAINHLICVNLQDEGYSCTCAFDGHHAAELIEKNHYDLILPPVFPSFLSQPEPA